MDSTSLKKVTCRSAEVVPNDLVGTEPGIPRGKRYCRTILLPCMMYLSSQNLGKSVGRLYKHCLGV